MVFLWGHAQGSIVRQKLYPIEGSTVILASDSSETATRAQESAGEAQSLAVFSSVLLHSFPTI